MDHTADPGDIDSIFDGSNRSPPNPNVYLGPDLENPFSRQNPSAPSGFTIAPSPSGSNPAPQYAYPEVHSLYELMADDPRIFYIPPQLMNVPVEKLRFPYNYIAKGIRPTIPNVAPLETFAHFGIYFSPEVYTIADSLTDLQTVLQDLPDGFVRWFPSVFQEQADGFIRGGGGVFPWSASQEKISTSMCNITLAQTPS